MRAEAQLAALIRDHAELQRSHAALHEEPIDLSQPLEGEEPGAPSAAAVQTAELLNEVVPDGPTLDELRDTLRTVRAITERELRGR